MKKAILIALLTAVSMAGLAQTANNNYVATVWGARSDGETDSTGSIQKAVDEISAKGGGTLRFTVGRYVTGAIELKDNVTIEIGGGAVIVGSTSIYDYKGAPALIWAKGRQNVNIKGGGTIEGRHHLLSAHINSQIEKGLLPEGFAVPELVSLENCINSSVAKNMNLRDNTAASFK